MCRAILCLLFFPFLLFGDVSDVSDVGKEIFTLNAEINVSGSYLRVKDGGVRVPDNLASDVAPFNKIWEDQVNLYLNFEHQKSYAALRFKFDNEMGSLGGTTGNIQLLVAYLGYQFFYQHLPIINLEVGRHVTSDYFESKVMFSGSNHIDGVFLHLHHHFFNKLIIFNLYTAGIVIDFPTDHYGFIGSVEVEHYKNSGPAFVYTYVDWEKNGRTAIFNLFDQVKGFQRDNPRFRFRISQFYGRYIYRSGKNDKFPIQVYGAYLINHAARRISLTGNRKKNNAWYIGLAIGELKPIRWSFSFDVNYQSVAAQAVPDFDVGGVGTGNPRANIFYGPARNNFTGAPVVVTQANANGNVNYQGWDINFIIALTKYLHLHLEYQTSHPEDRSIGPDRSYRAFTAHAIFLW